MDQMISRLWVIEKIYVRFILGEGDDNHAYYTNKTIVDF